VGTDRRSGSGGGIVIAGQWNASRFLQWLLIGVTSAMVIFHGVGWITAATVLWQEHVTLHPPQIQSAIVIALALLVLRSASAPRRKRRLIVLCVLMVTAVSFVAVPLPKYFAGEGLMPGGNDTGSSRAQFENRFRVDRGDVLFHSHLSDVAMTTLDSAFGRSETSPARAYNTLSRLAGLLFLLELAVAAAWHRWSRQVCRYVGLALAAPLCLLYFGYWDLGYLSIAVGVVPLLALARGRIPVPTHAAALVAGLLQGLHAALHGFGLIGLAGGALATLSRPGDVLRRGLRAATFTSAGVALYVGWIFFYVTIGRLSIEWERQLGYRPFFESIVFDNKIATPLFSQSGFGEFGLLSALSGVPLLAFALLQSRRGGLVPAALYALPGLIFLVQWWPPSAPFNLDLMLSVFPGLFAAFWVLASSHRSSKGAFFVLMGLHVLLWTTVGNAVFARVDVTP